MKVLWKNYKQFIDELYLVGYLASVSTDNPDPSKYINIARHCIKSGHMTPTRAMRFVFEIEGISRVVSHEFVRHEMGVIKVQQSQRYVDVSNSNFSTPSEVVSDWRYSSYVSESFSAYGYTLEDGYKKEIARYVLPNACHTKLHVCFNWEGLSNFLQKRLCNRAQPEMRQLAEKIQEKLYGSIPETYHDLLDLHMNTKCDIVGYCNEVQCCKKRPTREQFMTTYTIGKITEEGGK